MGFVMEANILNLIAACVMAQEWGMEELSFILYPNGYLEMEGNYSLRDDGWGGLSLSARLRDGKGYVGS